MDPSKCLFQLQHAEASSAVFRCSEDPLLLIQIQLGSRLRFTINPRPAAQQGSSGDTGTTAGLVVGEGEETYTELAEEIVYPSGGDPIEEEEDELGTIDPIVAACLINGDSGGPKKASSSAGGDDDNEEQLVAEFYYMHENDPIQQGTSSSSFPAVGVDNDDDEDDGEDDGWFYFGSIFKNVKDQTHVLRGHPVPLSPLLRATSKGRYSVLDTVKLIQTIGEQHHLELSCHFSTHRIEANLA